mgnify:FL=1
MYFYPRSPCGERPCLRSGQSGFALFLSTLSLRRATSDTTSTKTRQSDFYPRSPCGERHWMGSAYVMLLSISIHALLAESDKIQWCDIAFFHEFLSTLSLRRATSGHENWCTVPHISIHALLAESDDDRIALIPHQQDFYPRSPCGERLSHFRTLRGLLAFLSTLSLRRATVAGSCRNGDIGISIHALLAESDHSLHSSSGSSSSFLSTLSLRRATFAGVALFYTICHFYPRSPCGERPGILLDLTF